MKILVVNNMAPFVWGGAEELAVHLQKNLIRAGHQSEVLRIPFRWEPAHHIPSQMLSVRALEMWNVDRVIALKFPAYLIRHPHKTLWLLHQYRQAYDLLEAGQSNLSTSQHGKEIRQAIIAADNETFRESQRIFVISPVIQQRLKKFNQFDSEVLIPPLNDPELFLGGEDQGYIFAGGRINGMKRQHLLVEAMAKLPSSVRLVVAGPADTPEDAQRLQKLVEQHGLTDRVKLDIRFLPRAEYAAYLNGATAVAYLPFDEDALSYVGMEAATAGKPIITASDSGGVLGLVKQGQTGWIASPNVESVAQTIAEATRNHNKTKQLGLAAREFLKSLNITWPHTIERLTA
jgi:glycosyltransferase involved in cell wall biosynthesis